jgi:hypothetical protein
MVNLTDIDRVARISMLRVVAFGATPAKRAPNWLEQCLEAFMQSSDHAGADEHLYCLGLSKDGQPLHPLARGKLRVPVPQDQSCGNNYRVYGSSGPFFTPGNLRQIFEGNHRNN